MWAIRKSAITSKSKLAAVAKHNLRKYKSSDYSKDNICIIYGTSNLIDDVKTVYHKEFDEALEEYNKKQIRPDRKIEDYFETLYAQKYEMKFRLYFSDVKPKMAIFVSKLSHCLFDMLARYTAGEWNVEIPLIISNHPICSM